MVYEKVEGAGLDAWKRLFESIPGIRPGSTTVAIRFLSLVLCTLLQLAHPCFSSSSLNEQLSPFSFHNAQTWGYKALYAFGVHCGKSGKSQIDTPLSHRTGTSNGLTVLRLHLSGITVISHALSIVTSHRMMSQMMSRMDARLDLWLPNPSRRRQRLMESMPLDDRINEAVSDFPIKSLLKKNRME